MDDLDRLGRAELEILVDERYLDFISRLPKKAQPLFVTELAKCELLGDEVTKQMLVKWLRLGISEDGKGRSELIEAMASSRQAEHMADLYMDTGSGEQRERKGKLARMKRTFGLKRKDDDDA